MFLFRLLKNLTFIFLTSFLFLSFGFAIDLEHGLRPSNEIEQTTEKAKKIRILVDMDGVIADFEKESFDRYRTRYPELPFIPLKERVTFYASEDYNTRFGSEYKQIIANICNEKDFFNSLPIIEGAKEALNQMIEKGYEVFLCTSPLQNFQYCVLEKYEWINTHFGKEWVARIILTRDKTIVNGDILIDDRPEIQGSDFPKWKHILFHQPYNSQVNKPRIVMWDEWEAVVLDVINSG